MSSEFEEKIKRKVSGLGRDKIIELLIQLKKIDLKAREFLHSERYFDKISCKANPMWAFLEHKTEACGTCLSCQLENEQNIYEELEHSLGIT